MSEQTQVDTPSPSQRIRKPIAVATVGLLAVLGLGPLVLPVGGSVSVEEDPELGSGVRIAPISMLQRGPEPDEFAQELRQHGIDVEVTFSRDLTPWKADRVIGMPVSGFSMPDDAPIPGSSLQMHNLDFTEDGLRFHGNGDLTVFPSEFEGTVTLNVAVPVWQRMPSASHD